LSSIPKNQQRKSKEIMERKRATINMIKSGLIIALLISNSELVLGQQEVWTYDFGSESGTHTTGESLSFLPNPQTNGGVSRVRVGSGGGALSLKSSETGTFSALSLQAADNTSDVLFQVSGFNSSDMFYARFSMRLTGGLSGTIGFLFGNGENFTGNSGYVGASFAGFRSSFEPDGTLLTERRTSTTWSDAFGIGSVFTKDQTHTVEVYVNNSGSETAYFRDGAENNLASREWALWVDGVKFSDFGSVGLALDEAIDGFLFYGQSSSGNVAHMEIDDLVYSNSLPDIRRIESFASYSTNGEWRMLSLPYDATVEQLARQTLIQGVSGSFPDAASNIFTTQNGTGEATSQDSDWIAPAGLSDVITRGHGFIWLLYDNALIPENKPLPLDLTIASGTDNKTDTNVSLISVNDGWNLLGNPFSEDLRVDNIASWPVTGGSLASSVAQVYDPRSDSYVILNQADDKVAAFQGFFLQNGSASGITIPSAARSGGAQFYKDTFRRGVISLQVRSDENSNGAVFKDRALELFFTDDADHSWDQWDASKLMPLSNPYIGLGFAGMHNGVRVLKAQDSRPYDLEGSITIPLEFFSEGLNGSAELSIQEMSNIPAGLSLEIEDTFTGERQILSKKSPFRFDFNSTTLSKEMMNESQEPPVIQSVTVSSESPRFLLHINSGDVLSATLPSEIKLNQNYPNPFNPTTTISFELPESMPVNLSVYDMLGRRVATLVNETVAAGTHQVQFDASGLSGGIYLYRLKSGSNIQTKRLTLAK
jgi:hypothetical protein